MPDHRKLTQDELYAEARQRFGPDPRDWAFRCPGCGDIATARDFPEGMGERIGQECVGRHLGALERPPRDGVRGCDWVAYGLIRGPWIVTMPDGGEIGSFPLADAPAPKPSRIQLKRVKGWRLPDGAVSVGRGSRWGNPFTVAKAIEWGYAETEAGGRKVAVERFRQWLLFLDPGDGDIYVTNGGRYDRRWMRDHLPELRGKTLACWCPLPADGEPDICHGAVLLEVSNA